MTPLTLQVLRRLTTYALGAIVLLWAVPPALRHFALIGPGVGEQIESAARALEAARTYGADERSAPYRAGAQALERARREQAQGRRHAALAAAEQARAQAVEAQRRALAERDELRRKATATIDAIDHELNALEALYDQVTRDLPDRASEARLLSLMKATRQAGARLFLAYEQGDHRKVVADADQALATLAAARATLAAAARH